MLTARISALTVAFALVVMFIAFEPRSVQRLAFAGMIPAVALLLALNLVKLGLKLQHTHTEWVANVAMGAALLLLLLSGSFLFELTVNIPWIGALSFVACILVYYFSEKYYNGPPPIQ